jgi:hypothetical protein
MAERLVQFVDRYIFSKSILPVFEITYVDHLKNDILKFPIIVLQFSLNESFFYRFLTLDRLKKF